MTDVVEQLSQLRRPFVPGTDNLSWISTGTEALRLLDAFTEEAPVLIDAADVYKAPHWRGPEDEHMRAEEVVLVVSRLRALPADVVDECLRRARPSRRW
jgi:hypothetical protein